MSPVDAIPPVVLANNYLLTLLESTPFHDPINSEKMEEATYLAYQPWQARQPDHVFRSRWQAFCAKHQAGPGHWVLPALAALADGYLSFRHSTLHAQIETYSEWQNLLSRLSSLPIQAAAYARSQADNRFGKLPQPNNGGLLPLLYPFDQAVDDYIDHEGLHETHLHLNGSTHTEYCWLSHLLRPRRFLQDLHKTYGKRDHEGARFRELCHSINPTLTPDRLYHYLLLARLLRQWLLSINSGQAERYEQAIADRHAKTGSLADKDKIPRNVRDLLETGLPFSPDERNLLDHGRDRPGAEMAWQRDLLARLAEKPNPLADRLLHLYLLIQNQYLQLAVQREDMFGFDQFQKFTFSPLRHAAEESYTYRFRQMSGSHRQTSRVNWVEGRFSPKNSVLDNSALLSAILGGYLAYLENRQFSAEPARYAYRKSDLSSILDALDVLRPISGRHQLKLALVAHFIKAASKPGKESYRHADLRHKLESQCRHLAETLKRWPKLRHWLRGIDAAANELDASPEVFAPFFRVCQRQGISHHTFHAGEDFRHLIGGIRQVCDALNLLDLKAGDRIGHGTALGIKPAFWLASMPQQLLVKRGEWLLDLLVAWLYLRQQPACLASAQKLASEIAQLAGQIFGSPHSSESLVQVMAERGLLPRMVFDCVDQGAHWFWQSSSLSDNWREEARLVSKAKERGVNLSLLARWWRDEKVIERSEALIEVDASFLDADALLRLQQSALNEVQRRRVVIEMLPTSNVRISQYQHHREHHALRWLKVPGFALPDDPEIMVSLGSDDPGIFSNDLTSDFYHLYAVLREHGLNDMSALQYLATANERGRQYSFHDRDNFA